MVDWFCNTCLCIYLYRFLSIFQKKKRKAACWWLFKFARFVSMWRHQLMLATGCGGRYTWNKWLFVVACFQGRQLLKCISLARMNQPCKKKISHHVELYRFDEDAKPPNGQDTIVAPRMRAELTTLKYASFLSRPGSLMDLRTTEQS